MQDIKDYRQKEITMLILGNIFFLIYLLRVLDISTIRGDNINIIELVINILNSAILSSVLYVFTVILDGILSSGIKGKLLYLWIWKLPGETIFSTIKSKNPDKRFTYDDLKIKYFEIYNNMPQDKKELYKYENKEWYKIYSRNREQSMVFYSQREYLMFRDMYISNILIGFIYMLFSLGFHMLDFDIRYIIYLFVFIVIFNVVARSKAKRFAFNVIASDVNQ